MAVVALGSVRSCGVTTTAAGLAMLWPEGRPRALVEADPTGGTLTAATGLAPEPGLLSLAAAARRREGPELVFEHCQELPDGTPVLCAPPSPARARSALAMASSLLARLGELGADTFLDCGRLDPAGPSTDLFERADLPVLLSRPRLADLSALAEFLESHGKKGTERALVVLVGPGPYPPAEVSEALGVEVAGQLPWDSEAAEAMLATAPSARRLTRTPLVRALRTLADQLARRAAPSTVITDASAVEGTGLAGVPA